MKSLYLTEKVSGERTKYNIGEITGYESGVFSFDADSVSDSLYSIAREYAEAQSTYLVQFLTDAFEAGTISDYPTAVKMMLEFSFNAQYQCTFNLYLMSDDDTSVYTWSNPTGARVTVSDSYVWHGPIWYTSENYEKGTNYYTGRGGVIARLLNEETSFTDVTGWSNSLYYNEIIPTLGALIDDASSGGGGGEDEDITAPATSRGGYRIIDLSEFDFESGVAESAVIDVSGNKATLVSGLKVNDVSYPDMYIPFVDGSAVVKIADRTITINITESNITVTVA